MGLSKHSLYFIIGIVSSLLGLWYVTSGIDYGYRYSLNYQDVILFSAIGIGILIVYVAADLLGKKSFQWWAIIAAMLCLVIVPTIVSINHRLTSEPYFYVHDNPVQVEEAAKMLLSGKNPYGADYSKTVMGAFNYAPPQYDFNDTPMPAEAKINPGLYHTVSLPFGLLAVLPWYIVWNALFLWFDARIVYLFSYIALVAIGIWLIPKDRRLDFAPLFALNPLFASYVIEGHNDTLVILLVVITLFLAQRKKFIASAIPLGLALATKQSSWPFALLYGMYLWFVFPKKSRKQLLRIAGVTLGVATICIAPFLLWNAKTFWADTMGFTAGTVPFSYPIRGVGFSMVLVVLGLIPNTQAPYPASLLQILFALPIVTLSWRVISRQPTLKNVAATSGLLLLVLLFFSRFFIDNYVGSVLVYFLLGYFLPDELTPARQT